MLATVELFTLYVMLGIKHKSIPSLRIETQRDLNLSCLLSP